MGWFDWLLGGPGPLDEEAFAKAAIRAFAKAGTGSDFVHEVDGQRLHFTVQGQQMTISLTNLRLDFNRLSRAERRQFLPQFVRSLTGHAISPPAGYAEAKASLLPIVRSALEDVQLKLAATGTKWDEIPDVMAARPLAADLVVGLALDTERTMMRISDAQLRDWGVDFDQALADAIDNLRDRTVDRWVSVFPGVFMAAWSDSYDGSRLLLTDVVHRLAVAGDPVAMVPAREVVLVTGDRNENGLAALLQIARKAFTEEPRPISSSLIRLAGKTWESYEPPAAVQPAYANFRRQVLAHEYQQQKQVLDALHEREGAAIFVASVMEMQLAADPHPVSLCIWSKGVDSLLPETDYVALHDADDQSAKTAIVPFAVAREIVGDLMAPVDLALRRYRVRHYPSPEQLAELAAHALQLRDSD